VELSGNGEKNQECREQPTIMKPDLDAENMANSDSGTHDYLLRFCEAEWSCDSIIRTLSPADLSFDVFNFNKSLNAATFLWLSSENKHRKTVADCAS
jgi:hypothetical protein